jgi:ferric-dicitrate binding protein FerR (iron transport regulator)
VHQARTRTSRRYVALAAGLVVAAAGLSVLGLRTVEPVAAAGTLAAVSGGIRERSGWLSSWRAMERGDVVMAGRTLQTGADGGATLALSGAVSARLDRDTRIEVIDRERLRLEQGTLYVDAGPNGGRASRLEVETGSGAVRHVGTQYELKLLGTGTRLRVREGSVEWRSAGGAVARGLAGEQLMISAEGDVRREPVARYGSSWDWVVQAAPAIDLEGMPLTQFLAWAARELGREVAFSPALSEAELATIVLHGSTGGLTPADALHAVLATTSVQAVIDDGRIVIERRATR